MLRKLLEIYELDEYKIHYPEEGKKRKREGDSPGKSPHSSGFILQAAALYLFVEEQSEMPPKSPFILEKPQIMSNEGADELPRSNSNMPKKSMFFFLNMKAINFLVCMLHFQQQSKSIELSEKNLPNNMDDNTKVPKELDPEKNEEEKDSRIKENKV